MLDHPAFNGQTHRPYPSGQSNGGGGQLFKTRAPGKRSTRFSRARLPSLTSRHPTPPAEQGYTKHTQSPHGCLVGYSSPNLRDCSLSPPDEKAVRMVLKTTNRFCDHCTRIKGEPPMALLKQKIHDTTKNMFAVPFGG